MEHHASIESAEHQYELTRDERITLTQNYAALQMRNNAYTNIQYIRGLENRKKALTALVQYEKIFGSLGRIGEILIDNDKDIYKYALIKSALYDGDVHLADWHAAHTPNDTIRSECYVDICRAIFSEVAFGWMNDSNNIDADEGILFAIGVELIPRISSAKLKARAIIAGANMEPFIENAHERELFFHSLLSAIQAIPTASIRNEGMRALAKTYLYFDNPERAQVFLEEHISDSKEKEMFLPDVVLYYAEQKKLEKAHALASSIRDPLIRTRGFCMLANGYRIQDDIRQKALESANDSLSEAKRLGIHSTDEYDAAKAEYILANNWIDPAMLERDLSDMESSLERDRVRMQMCICALQADDDPDVACMIARRIADPSCAAEALGGIIEYHIENGNHEQAERIAHSINMPHIHARLWMKIAHIGAEHFRNSGHIYHRLEEYIATLESTEDRHRLMAEYIESILTSARAYHNQSLETLTSLSQDHLVSVVVSLFDGDDTDTARMAFYALTEDGRAILNRRAAMLSRQRRKALQYFIASGNGFLANE